MSKGSKKRKANIPVYQEDVLSQLNKIDDIQRKALIERDLLLEKAFKSKDPDTLLKANDYWTRLKGQQGIETKGEAKSYFLDPFALRESLGFRERIHQLSYTSLRKMAGTPIIKAIISTRVEQVAAFSSNQSMEQKMGWMIRIKQDLSNDEEEKADKKEVKRITDFILNCGNLNKEVYGGNWKTDNFDVFLRKIVPDALVLDQATFEIVRNRKGQPHEYFATDGATYRLAETSTEFSQLNREEIEGFYPTVVQLLNGEIWADFYPWELCFGVRNPQTNIDANGYGRSELEDMVRIVTWMLYGDQYNGRFFSQGAAPKGILKLAGHVNEGRLQEFRQQWQAQTAGVTNAWKTPILEAEKMDWVDLQKSNQDMQFSLWQEYLIKLTCALYKIDPAEIGFNLSQGANLFGENQQAKLEYSKEKGLKPLMKFLQEKINQYLVRPLNPAYEFVWTGLEIEDEASQIDLDIKKLSGGLVTWKEIRRKYLLPETMSKDDFLLNQIWLQIRGQQMQGNPDSNDAMSQFGGGNFFAGDDKNPFLQNNDQNPFLNNDGALFNKNPFTDNGNTEDNPFVKGVEDALNELLKEQI